MTNEILSPREIQTAQLLIGIATAVFIGGRYLPARFRRPVSYALTFGYLAGVAVFMLYAVSR